MIATTHFEHVMYYFLMFYYQGMKAPKNNMRNMNVDIFILSRQTSQLEICQNLTCLFNMFLKVLPGVMDDPTNSFDVDQQNNFLSSLFT